MSKRFFSYFAEPRKSGLYSERRTPARFLVITPTLAVGGAEMDLIRNLPRLDSTRFKVVVWTLHVEGALAPLLRERGIEVVGPSLTTSATQPATAPSEKRLYLAGPLRAAWAAMSIAYAGAKFVRLRDFDAIHAVLPSAYLVAVLINLLAGRRPLVMSRLSLNWYQRDNWIFGLVERHFLHRFPDVAIGNCNVILDELRAEGLPDRKLVLVHNGIDAAAFDAEMVPRVVARRRFGISEDALVLSSVANLHFYKGHADLIEALARCRSRLQENWILLVAGADVDGNLEKLRRLVDERDLAENVRFLGQRFDVPVILSASDIHVSASHSEGFPNNILEAMCARLPVIATAVGGVPEQVRDGVTGILVSRGDLTALSNALVALAQDAEQRRQLGLQGRQRVEREFTIGRSVAGFEAIYDRLAVARRNRRYPRPSSGPDIVETSKPS